MTPFEQMVVKGVHNNGKRRRLLKGLRRNTAQSVAQQRHVGRERREVNEMRQRLVRK